MAMSDEFPEYYFADDNGSYIWESSDWGDEAVADEYSEKTAKAQENTSYNHFINLEEAKKYAMKNPGATFVRNPNGSGFVLKGAIHTDKSEYKHKQEAIKREENIKYGKPVNSGISWRDKELAVLIMLHAKGDDINSIAKSLERTVLSISAKLRNLELISENEHQETMAKYSNSRF